MSVGTLSVVLELDGADNFITTINRAATSTNNLTSSIQTNISMVNNLTNVHNNAGRAASGHAESIGNLVVVLGQAKNAFNFLKDATTSWAQSIVNANAKMESMTLLLKGISTATTEVTRSAEALQNFNYLLDKASSSPFKLDKLTDAFVKMRGAGIEPTEKALDSIVDAVAHFGGNDQTLERVALAMQQMAGKGVVSMEELRRQLGDAVPGAMKAMAQSMNMTVAQLNAAVTKGTLESTNAIRQMTAEFERLYGGSSVQKLETFSGQMALLNTQFQRLQLVAGGMSSDGKYADSGFFKTITEGLKELNVALKTPEFTAFAIRISESLAQVVQGIISASKFLYEWGGVIASVAITVGQFIIVMKALEGAMALQAAIQGSVMLQTVIGNLRNLGSIAASVGGIFANLAGSYISWAGSIVSPIMAAGSAITTLEGAAVAAVAPLGALTASLVFIAAPVAVIAGLAAIAYALSNVENRGKLASDALNRIKQGDLTKGTEDTARTELAALEDRIKKFEDISNKLAQVKSGKLRSVTPGDYGDLKAPREAVPTGDFGGTTSVDMAITQKNAKDDSVVKYEKNLTNELTTEYYNRQQALKALDGLNAARATNAGKVAFDNIKNDFEKNLFEVNNAYRQTTDEIAKEREAIAGKQDSASIATEQALNTRMAEARHTEYQKRLDDFDKLIEQQKTAEAAATAQGNAQLAAQIQSTLSQMGDYRTKLKQAQTDEDGNVNRVVTTDATKLVAQRAKEAQNAIQQLQARIQANDAEVAGANGNLAKMVYYLSDLGKFNGINPELKAQLLAVAEQAANAEDRLKRFKTILAAETKIDEIGKKAADDIQGYIDKLTDPNMTEGQRSFINIQTQVNAQLRAIKEAATTGKAGLAELTQMVWGYVTAASAMRNATISTVLQEAATANKEADAARLQKLNPTERRAEGVRQNKAKYDTLRLNAQGISDEELSRFKGSNGQSVTRDQLIKDFNDAESAKNASLDRGVAKAGAGQAKATENAYTSLLAKIAQLRGEMNDTGKETEKVEALIARGKFVGDPARFREAAVQYDALTEAIKKLHVARQAEENLKLNVEDTRTAAEELAVINGQTTARGKMLGVERELFDYKRRTQKEVSRVETLPVGGEAGLSDAAKAQRVANAQQDANLAVSQQATYLSRKAMDENKTETETIMKSVETSLEKRRDAGYKEVADFEASQRRVIAAAQVSADERKRMEDQLAQTIGAKRLQVERQTENSLEKWVRESMDMTTQISNFGASAFSQLTDALTTFATTGKFSFTDLATWAIKELARITLSSAFATLVKGVSGASGAGGGINFASIIGGIAGAFAGSAGGVTQTTTDASAGGAQMFGPYTGQNPTQGFYVKNHSGGMVGFEGSSTSIPFSGLPRFHTGTYLKSDETASILQKGEAVFTAGQLGAIGRMNHSYEQVEAQMGMMTQAMSNVASQPRVPSSFAPAQSMNPTGSMTGGSGAGSAPPVTVNMHNQSGNNMDATAGQPKFNGEQWVIDVVMKNSNRPGPLRNSMASMSR